MNDIGMAEKSSLGTRKTNGKIGLVWRNRKKISQIINAYLCLPFFFIIILWLGLSRSLNACSKWIQDFLGESTLESDVGSSNY
jgi:hypothetical protein